MKIRFNAASNLCCAICNPLSLIDYETDGISIEVVNGVGQWHPLEGFCRACIKALYEASEGNFPLPIDTHIA